ncbi:MAG: cation diffusion facilitator family transporter [Eubacteriales bacterium]|nr:cation diffusion facilitator family transporter [Eubacteriales bacterium]
MTERLIRLFIKDENDPKARIRFGNLTSAVGLAINVMLFLSKVLASILTSSLAIRAEAIDNLTDSLTNILALLSFYLSAKPADAEHPYGHMRLELMLSMLVGMSILFLGGTTLVDSIKKIINPVTVNFHIAAIVVLFISMTLKIWLRAFYTTIANKIDSEMLRATAADSFTDVLRTAGVIISIFISIIFKVNLDGYIGLIISALIIKNGVEIIKDNVSLLLGHGAYNPVGKKIMDFIQSRDKVLDVHDLMMHEYGGNNRFATVDISLDADMRLEEAHLVADSIERAVDEKFGYRLIVHMDPVRTKDSLFNSVRKDVEKTLKQVGCPYRYQDLQALPLDDGSIRLSFDLLMPPDKMSEQANCTELICDRLTKINSQYIPIVRRQCFFEHCSIED